MVYRQANQQRCVAGADLRDHRTMLASWLTRQVKTLGTRTWDVPTTSMSARGALATTPDLMNTVAPAQARQGTAGTSAAVSPADPGFPA